MKIIEYGRKRRSNSKSRRSSPRNQARDPSKSRSKIQ